MQRGHPLRIRVGTYVKGLQTDIAIIGGGLGACAAALAATRFGHRVILTEETHWVGGQLTNQAVPPDEHPWIEDRGATATYRALRRGIRDFYRRHTPLTAEAQSCEHLNPGNGWVSRLCHDPRVAVAVLRQMMAPHEINGRLRVLYAHRPVEAWTHGDRISGVVVRGLESEQDTLIEASYFIDATPYGDLLDLAKVEHVIGAESRDETGEPHAFDHADPMAQQAITVCFAIEHLPGEDHTIDKPRQYETWRAVHPSGWPGPLLGWTSMRPETHEPLRRMLFDAEDGRPWWNFRRILDRRNFEPGFAASDVTVVNWPQNDYWVGPLVGVSATERASHLESARQLSLSLLYWLQTEAPRSDGGVGYAGLRLRGDVVGGTPDGLALAPYVRESRRLRAELTVVEQDIAYPLRQQRSRIVQGLGRYRRLSPRSASSNKRCGLSRSRVLAVSDSARRDGACPRRESLARWQEPRGHAHHERCISRPSGGVERRRGFGLLAAFCLQRKLVPRAVRNTPALLAEFQALLAARGIELDWPSPLHPI